MLTSRLFDGFVVFHKCMTSFSLFNNKQQWLAIVVASPAANYRKKTTTNVILRHYTYIGQCFETELI